MNKDLTFIAPGNSIYSFKWISSITDRYDGDIYWITFFGADYSIPGVKQIEFKRNIKDMLNAIFFIKNHVKGIIYIHSLGFLPSFLKIYNFARIKIIALWKSILWMTVIFNSVMVLLITNTTDLMLWWAVILSGTILTKKHIIKL